MPVQHYTIQDARGNKVQVNLRRDKRLKVTSRWERLPDGSILLRVPNRLPNYKLGSLLEQVRNQLDKAEKSRCQRTDAELHDRAELVNRRHFGGKIQWNAIRWVSNMRTRLGSCTRGGPTDAQIRISDKIRSWPDWVIDYVIAHELMHRKHPNHSPEFWNELKAAYPLTERALGFIHGLNFATGQPSEDQD
ncbi:MAG: M48 family metallopeptidase [Acidobacteriaceae bacterium]